jgi:tetrahydromethanopterin S-methyltransferase subunit G
VITGCRVGPELSIIYGLLPGLRLVDVVWGVLMS